MKKVFFTFAMLAIIVSGCSKFEEDIANLNNRIDNIEKVTIPSINSQISSINSTISSLKSINNDLDSEILALAQRISTLGQNIDAIESLISAFDGDISRLESVLSSIRKSVTDLGTESESKLDKVKADLEAKIGNLNGELDSLVDDLSLLSEEDQKFILELAALKKQDQELEKKITELQSYVDTELSKAVDAAAAAYATLQQYNSVLEQLTNLNQSITQTDTEIRAKIATEISNLNARIAELNERLDKLEENVESILKRIQSIAYVPTTANGKATFYYNIGNDGTLDKGGAILTFEVRPASAATELAANWRNALKIKAAYTQTRSTIEFADLAIEDAVATADGLMQIAVSGESLKDEFFSGTTSANICLEVSDENNTFSTEYVNIIPWNDTTVYVPDFKFHAYLVENFDTNNDKKISISEAGVIERITVDKLLSAPSLKGVEYCTNLTILNCANNKLENLNINNLILIEELNASGNKLSTLDISNLVAMQQLDLSSNELKTLDVRQNIQLTELNVSSNKISSIDISTLVNLKNFCAHKNSLITIDISKNTQLYFLGCSYNQLSTVDLRNCPELIWIYLSNNKLSALNLSNNTQFNTIDCHSNTALSTMIVWEGFVQNSHRIIADANLRVMDIVGNPIQVNLIAPEDITNDIPVRLYKIGQLVYRNRNLGVVFYSDDAITKIISVDETTTIWGLREIATGANDWDNGINNVNIVKNNGFYNSLPAFIWCGNYGIDWYLPAPNELKAVYHNMSTINSALSAQGYTTISRKAYWSSCEDSSTGANLFHFSNGTSDTYGGNKEYSNLVRAVLVF